MNSNTIIGLDIAKNTFHLVEIDEKGRELRKKLLYRREVLEFFINLEKTTVAMEACGGSNYWGRKLIEMGHFVKIIPAEKVKPYLLSKQKNDYNDARAIAEAASRKNVKYITPGTVKQQDIQMLLRVRSRIVDNKVAVSNQIRGLLMEYGIVCNKGFFHLLDYLKNLQNDPNAERSLWKMMLQDLYNELLETIEKIQEYDKLISKIANKNEDGKRLMKLDGIGPVTALALLATINNIHDFKNGRQLSAYFGIVPKQHSTGGKTKLLGITKRGDAYVRKLLIHGARACLQYVSEDKDPWLYQLKKRAGYNKAAVAQANKTTRQIFAVLKKKDKYNFELKCTA